MSFKPQHVYEMYNRLEALAGENEEFPDAISVIGGKVQFEWEAQDD